MPTCARHAGAQALKADLKRGTRDMLGAVTPLNHTPPTRDEPTRDATEPLTVPDTASTLVFGQSVPSMRRATRAATPTRLAQLALWKDDAEYVVSLLEERTVVATLRAALAPYLDVQELRDFVATGGDLRGALRTTTPPEIVDGLLAAITALLQPTVHESIRGPADVAGLFMATMGHLDQEELRGACLSTKNSVQRIVTVYRGQLGRLDIRIGEVFTDALRAGSAGIVLCHNHPSGAVDPSTEDIAITKQIVEAGDLLGVEVLDHLIVGHGRWYSLREHGQGFSR